MKMRCFVPNCENTIGISFPENYELQNIWLKGLQFADGVPNVDSFVCFDHFEKNDIEEIVSEEGSVERKVRSGAVPRLFTLADTIEKETEEFLEFRNPKIVTSQKLSPLPDNSEPQEEQSESFKDVSVEPPSVPNVVLNTVHSNFVPQFQEFQEEDFILEQQEFSESQSSSQSFSGYSQQTDVQNQDQDISQESNLVIQENQDFLTIQHEFTPQQVFTTEEQVFSSESQSSQIYTPPEQPIFTRESNEVFVPESQPLLTQEGHQVFMSEDNPNISAVEESFTLKEKCIEHENAQFIKQENTQLKEVVLMEDQEMSLDQRQMNNEQENHIHNEQNISEEATAKNMESSDKTVNNKFQELQDDHDPEVNNLEHKPLVMDNEEVTSTHSEISQESTSQMVIEEQAPLLQSCTPPENIVMQWFVPNQPLIKSEPVSQSKELIDTTEDDNRIMVTYQQEPKASQPRFTQQHMIVSHGQDSCLPNPIKTMKKLAEGLRKEDACRLCMSKEQVSVNILDNVKDNIMVLEAIQLCIHPLEISLEDPFSKSVCVKCFNLLQKYFEFRQNCIKIDADQKRTYEKAHPLHRFLEKRKHMSQYGNYPKKTHMKTIISPSKLGYRQTEIVTVMSPSSKRSGLKNVSRKVILTPTPKKRTPEEIQYLLQNVRKEAGPKVNNCVKQIISKVSKADDIQVFKLRKTSPPSQNCLSYSTKYTTVQKTTAVPISLSHKKFKPCEIEALARKPPLSTEKQIKIQEELKKVIEGTMSKDDLSVDQVIVRVVSDDETDEKLEHFPAKRKKSSVPITESKQEFSKMKIGRSEVVIPKGIRVSIPEKFESSKGTFPCFPKIGAFETKFCLIDGYLFEHRLCKGQERFLRCVSMSCTAQASQKLLDTGKFENRAYVKTPHNHHQLTSTEIKKQMFYYVMKKKMQADKGLNFRSVYDQICAKDPEIKSLVPLRTLINEICKHQLTQKMPQIKNFEDFYNAIEDDSLQKYQFTYLGKQFYQERFTVKEEGTKAVIFANTETIKKVSDSKLMYVDASFKIETGENFSYQLVTVLVWIDDSEHGGILGALCHKSNSYLAVMDVLHSIMKYLHCYSQCFGLVILTDGIYYPIMFAIVSDRTMEIFKQIFAYLHDTLAPNLCPEEIVTDYEANIYYALGETYLESHIGGSVFYYTQNLYKKICELGLSRELETTSYFRNIYHMLLMLPLLPVNTIMDGLQNIEIQANDLGVGESIAGLFEHIKDQWMEKVTPDLFCVHRLENRINENVIAPFKKLRDFLMLNKGKTQRHTLSIINVVEKLIDLDSFLQTTYSSENKKSFGRDLSSSQKKNVLKAWQYIETHPKININHFFTKVIGYIKCMENQLWIWGYYKFSGKVTDDLINAANFSIVNTNDDEVEMVEEEECSQEENSNFVYTEDSDNTVVVEAVVGPSGEFVISNPENNQESDNSIFKYVYK